MISLTKAMGAWNTPAFAATLKTEVRQVDIGLLPLQQGMVHGSHVNADSLDLMVIGVCEDATHVHVKTGIFYTSIIAGCSCADDPTPVDENAEYCEIRFDIDKRTAAATAVLL